MNNLQFSIFPFRFSVFCFFLRFWGFNISILHFYHVRDSVGGENYGIETGASPS